MEETISTTIVNGTVTSSEFLLTIGDPGIDLHRTLVGDDTDSSQVYVSVFHDSTLIGEIPLVAGSLPSQ